MSPPEKIYLFRVNTKIRLHISTCLEVGNKAQTQVKRDICRARDFLFCFFLLEFILIFMRA